MLSILTIGDVHLSETPPGRRAEGYEDQILAKLRECFSIAEANSVDLVVFIGDLLHRKRPNANSHRLVQRLAKVIADYGRPVWVLPGNHDMPDGTLAGLERAPVGTLGLLPNVELVWGERIWAEVDHDYVLRFIPGTAAVCDAAEEGASWFLGKADLIFAHAPMSETPLPWPTWSVHDLDFDPACQAFIYGHQHDEARYVGSAGCTSVVATGAIARGAISEANHTPAVVLLDLDDHGLLVDVGIIPLQNVAPMADVFRWAERAEEKSDAAALANFVANLGQAQLAGLSREGLIGTIRERADVHESVKAAAVHILESA